MKSKQKNGITKKQQIALSVVLSLGVGLGGGYLLANAANGDSTNSHAHTSNGHDDAMHKHGAYEVDAAEAPSVGLTVEEDAKSGWNITLDTENFTFAPEAVNGDNVPGEGHAHLYVDGEKVARLYGPHFHYDGAFDGTKTFYVTLNANDHSEYTVDGKAIAAEQQVTHHHH